MCKLPDACHKGSVLRDVTTCECLTHVRVVMFVICHLHSVLVVTITRIIPIVFGLALSLFTLVLTLASIASRIVLNLSCPCCVESLRDSLVPIQDPSISP